MIVAVLGPGLLNALYAIAVVNIPFFARNIRGLTVGLRQRDFIQAARLSGKKSWANLADRSATQRHAGGGSHYVDHRWLDDFRDRRSVFPRFGNPAAQR